MTLSGTGRQIDGDSDREWYRETDRWRNNIERYREIDRWKE